MDEPAPSGRGRGCCCLGGCLGLTAIPLTLAVFVAAIPFGFRAWAEIREVELASDIAPSSGRFINADDVAIYIQETGPEDGRPVLLVHGTSAWSGTWRDTQKALGKAGFRVIAMDLPPFGFSQRPDDARYDRPKQALRILGVLDALKIERVRLVGHSFGGGPTLEAALLAPERVERLVLVDAAISLDSAGADPGFAGTLAAMPWLRETAVACTFQNPLLTKKAVQSMIFDPSDATDDRVELYRAPFSVQDTTPAVGAWIPELAAPGQNAWSLDKARIRDLEIPTLLIWGREDVITPPEQAEQLDALLPKSQIRWLDGVGHIPHIEDVPAFHRALVPFLRKGERRKKR